MNNFFLRFVFGLGLCLAVPCMEMQAQPTLTSAQEQGVNDICAQSWMDVDYVGDSLEGHRLDVYLPKAASRHGGKPKVIVAIYGSAWFANNAKKAPMTSIGRALLEAGYAVVSINHRSSPEAMWPAQIQDVKAAIRYVRANAAKYGYDASFLGITGFSSGGHLSVTAATTNGVKTLKHGRVTIDVEGRLGQYVDTDSHVDAVCDWFGPVDMINTSDWVGHGGDSAPEHVLIGNHAPSKEPDWSYLISPVNFVTAQAPEILILHGTDDHVVGNAQSHHLKAAYDSAGVKATLIDVPGGDHGPGCFEAPYYKEMVNYFDRMVEKKAKVTARLEEVLTIDIQVTGTESVKVGTDFASMVAFNGHAHGPYFTGKVLPGGVDTQRGNTRGMCLSARYILDGKDKTGQPCRIFIENNGEFGAPFTHPTIVTDSKALSFLNDAQLVGRLDMTGGKLVIRIYRQ